MSLSRFYLPPESWSDHEMRLEGGEANHCRQVLRKQKGDSMELFDGRGRVACGTIAEISRSEVRVKVESCRFFAALAPRVHLVASIIKGDRMDLLLEKAVELGAASVLPVQSDHCVVRLNGGQLERKMEKWRQTLIAAAKQCHIPFLPDLSPVQSLQPALESAPPNALKMVAALDEQQHSIGDVMERQSAPPADIVVAIGPEGDFSPAELTMLTSHGFEAVTLGPLILRAETAAITALARLTAHRRTLEEVAE